MEHVRYLAQLLLNAPRARLVRYVLDLDPRGQDEYDRLDVNEGITMLRDRPLQFILSLDSHDMRRLDRLLLEYRHCGIATEALRRVTAVDHGEAS